jgi:hypothetical protein
MAHGVCLLQMRTFRAAGCPIARLFAPLPKNARKPDDYASVLVSPQRLTM